jgi:hypothetical protein
LSCISVHQQQGCKQLTINYLSKLQDIFVLLPHVYLLWSRLTIETNPQLDTNKIHFPQHIVSCIHSLTMFRLSKCLCSNECRTNLILYNVAVNNISKIKFGRYSFVPIHTTTQRKANFCSRVEFQLIV